MSSLLYLISLCLLAVGTIWMALSFLRKRSRRNPLSVLLIGFLLLLWSVILVNVNNLAVAWLVNLFFLLVAMYMFQRLQRKPESVSSHTMVPPPVEMAPFSPQFDYTSVEQEVAQLKREQRYNEAIELLTTYVDATESEAVYRGAAVRSWPYQQLAIIYRKTKDSPSEIEILERFSRQPNSGSKQSRQLLKRLAGKYEELYDDDETDRLRRSARLISRGVIVDCETTGFSNRDELIEIGILAFDFNRATGEVHDVVDQYSGLREPSCPIPADATAKHGLTIEHVRGQTIDAVKCAILLDTADVIIAHNASFDRRFVGSLFPSIQSKRWLCSMNGVDWRRYGHSSKALQSLLADFDIEPAAAHRALDDANATLQLISQTNASTGETYLAEILEHPGLA